MDEKELSALCKANSVYTLLRVSVKNKRYEEKVNVSVFRTLEDAKRVMQEEYLAELKSWKSWCKEEYIRIEEDDMFKRIYELHSYIDNHVEWLVQRQIIV